MESLEAIGAFLGQKQKLVDRPVGHVLYVARANKRVPPVEVALLIDVEYPAQLVGKVVGVGPFIDKPVGQGSEPAGVVRDAFLFSSRDSCSPSRTQARTRARSAAREGEILEVSETAGGVNYRVRWDDGHETEFRPAAGSARIVPHTGTGGDEGRVAATGMA